MQQFLKPATGTAWAGIIAADLLDKFLVPVHNAIPTIDTGLGRESPATLTRGLETRTGRGDWLWFSWHTSDNIIAAITGRASNHLNFYN
jgi:hypothetical protein